METDDCNNIISNDIFNSVLEVGWTGEVGGRGHVFC